MTSLCPTAPCALVFVQIRPNLVVGRVGSAEVDIHLIFAPNAGAVVTDADIHLIFDFFMEF